MTGLDVLARCRAYEEDMARLRLRRACARDAVTQMTGRPDADRTAQDGRIPIDTYVSAVDAIDRAMAARREMHLMELEAAATVLSALAPRQGQVMRLRMILRLTMRQTAGELHVSESSARGYERRAREALAGMTSTLDGQGRYRSLYGIYRDAYP